MFLIPNFKTLPAWLLIFCVLVLAIYSSAYAIEPGSMEPIEIESDQATLDDLKGISTYSGNVIISQGLSKLQADSIIVNSLDRKITTIIAKGTPAHFSQQATSETTNIHGYGREITYSTSTQTLTFTGEAKLIQAENSFSGDVIEYDVTKKAIKAKGDETAGSRVKIQYYPEDTNRSKSDKTN